MINCRVNLCVNRFFPSHFLIFIAQFAFLQLSLLPDITLVQRAPPPVVLLASDLPISPSLSPEGRAPQPQISFRNRRRGGRERRGERRRERRDERGAELQDEYEEKENGPEHLEERSRTRASAAAAAAAGRYREGERRCPRQAPARGVGGDRALVRWAELLSVRADLQILSRPASRRGGLDAGTCYKSTR